MSQPPLPQSGSKRAGAAIQTPRRAVFFDRDGVLNVDSGFVHKAEDFQWMPGAPDLIKRLNDDGWLVFVVTNQSGVARGMFDEQTVIGLHDWINRDLARIGARIDAFAYCPHLPEGIRPGYAIACECRKPAPGLFRDLMAQWPVDRDRSVVIGDRERDIAAGAAAGIKGHLFSGGNLLVFAQKLGLV